MISKSKSQAQFINAYGQESSYNIGQQAERRIYLYLRMRLYKILFTRWRDTNKKGTGAGEVDIIAKHGNTIVFIEVKSRNKDQDIMYSITKSQQHRIINSSMLFMAKHPEYENCNIRFDAVFVLQSNGVINNINHIQNAFDATDFASADGF